MKRLQFKSLPVLILSVFLLISCEPWNLEKREDHDFNPFETIIDEERDLEAYGITRTHDGGYAVVGAIWNTEKTQREIYIVKVDAAGTKLWGHALEADDDDDNYGTAITMTSDNGFLISGHIDIDGSDWQMYVVKINQAGNLSWPFTDGITPGTDESYSVVQKSDNKYYVLGNTDGFSQSYGIETLIIEFTENAGSFTKRYLYLNLAGDGMDDYGHSIIETAEGDLVFLATYINDIGNYDLRVIKLSENELSKPGLPVPSWDNIIIQNGQKINACIKQVSDGGFVAVGASSGDRLQLVKIKANGSVDWSKPFSNSNAGTAASVIQTEDRGYALLSSEMTLIKTDPTGTLQMQKDFNGTCKGNNCLLQSPDKGLIITGTTENNDILIRKIFPGN